ncbi:uncharacterized protein KQ657_002691 [Scheffersomyces spartinae]|uniref:PSP proline-rich domain-containing protein n=1 Tax=Scheffersomyces spartinae TaxID=45513 RepID=A0A9P7V5S3_9ASCO|nr:uncharacterized protein KQ657_002691 [Scheffersomyces spartinae]KAG7191902.1 hypothetical protein KQ657_002691 [Scheffersomyces spartinae]
MAKRSKNQVRREKAKLRKLTSNSDKLSEPVPTDSDTIPNDATPNESSTKEVEEGKPDTVGSSELFSQYSSVFQQFATEDRPVKTIKEKNEEDEDASNDDNDDNDDDSKVDSDDEGDSTALSARQLRKRNKVSLAALKALSSNPSVVEPTDVDAKDPFLHVYMKLQLNVVPVPQHWSSKRDFLSGRKGIEKLPFQLPKYIADTGIQEMRNVVEDDSRTLKQLQRERVQPKMGKLDIDYQKLHDAFFKHQSKPRLYAFGDVYYEGRETTDDYTEQIQDMKPGVISNDLRQAIGLTESSTSNVAPPWISVMERLGKPPSYSNFLIPGLDLVYSNTGYVLNATTAVEATKPSEHWGVLQEAVEEEESDEESDEESHDKAASEPAYDESSQEEEDHDEKVEIAEYGKYGGISKDKEVSDNVTNTAEDSSSTPGSKLLYQILEETSSTSKSGLLNSDKKYQI